MIATLKEAEGTVELDEYTNRLLQRVKRNCFYQLFPNVNDYRKVVERNLMSMDEIKFGIVVCQKAGVIPSDEVLVQHLIQSTRHDTAADLDFCDQLAKSFYMDQKKTT